MIFQSAVDINHHGRRSGLFDLRECFAAGFLLARQNHEFRRPEIRHLDGIDYHGFVASGCDDGVRGISRRYQLDVNGETTLVQQFAHFFAKQGFSSDDHESGPGRSPMRVHAR